MAVPVSPSNIIFPMAINSASSAELFKMQERMRDFRTKFEELVALLRASFRHVDCQPPLSSRG